jgi:hypothetical protein
MSYYSKPQPSSRTCSSIEFDDPNRNEEGVSFRYTTPSGECHTGKCIEVALRFDKLYVYNIPKLIEYLQSLEPPECKKFYAKDSFSHTATRECQNAHVYVDVKRTFKTYGCVLCYKKAHCERTYPSEFITRSIDGLPDEAMSWG